VILANRCLRIALILGLWGAAGDALSAAADPAGKSPARTDAYYHYSLAQQLIMERDYLHALEQMENAVASDSSPSLLLELAQLRYSLNDLTGATDLAEKVVAANPDLGEAHRLLGDIHLNRARDAGDSDTQVALAIEQYHAALQADPTDQDTCRALAELYYHTGRLKEAGETLVEFARKRPLDGQMSLLLGKVYARTGRLAESETLLRQTVARVPGNLEAADALASLLEFEKKYDEAIAVYRAAFEGDTDSAYVRTRLGTLHLLAGRYQEAIRDLQRAQTIDPSDSRGLLPLAQAYEGAEDTKGALQTYERLIQKEPANLEARFHRSRLQQKEGDTPGALKGYQDIIDLATGRGAVTDRESAILALAYSQIGLLQMEGRQYAAAVEAFTQALNTADEPGPELFLLLGRAELEAGKPAEARRVAAEAAKRFPTDLDVKVFQGEILIASGDEGGARDLYRGVLRETSGSSEAYGRVSEALLRQKRYTLADAFLKEATRKHPQDDALLFARGAALERQGRAAEAERMLSRAIEINPKNAMALNYLGYMLADRGVKLKEALAFVQRALALDPRNAAYLDSLGWAQFRLALYPDAEKSLRAALASDGGDPTIREHLGDLLNATGRDEEALREWQAALQRGHEEPERVRQKILKAQGGRPVTP
jgi:tetratricopeptide (TPR) repeat protein